MARETEPTGKNSVLRNALRIGAAVGAVQALRSSSVRSNVAKTFDKLKKSIASSAGSAGSPKWSVRDERKHAQMSADEVEKCVADCLNSAEGRAVTDQFEAATERHLHS